MILKKSLVCILVFMSIAYLCLSFNAVSVSVERAITLCCTNVIPSLFPFFVMADILMQNISFRKVPAPIAKTYSKLFRVDICTLPIFIAGLISGYPVGASASYDMYKKGAISKKDTERLICFTNNSGPLFVISAVGSGMFGSIETGIVLYIIHIISAFVTGIFIPGKKNVKGHNTTTKITHTKTISEIIENSFMKCIKICGFVIIFSIVSNCISDLTTPKISALLGCITEITGGIAAGRNEFPIHIALPLASFALGWSGLSVLMQVKSVTNGELSIKKYVLAKFANGILSGIICSVYINLRQIPVPCIASANTLSYNTTLAQILSIAVYVIILIYWYHKKSIAHFAKK